MLYGTYHRILKYFVGEIHNLETKTNCTYRNYFWLEKVILKSIGTFINPEYALLLKNVMLYLKKSENMMFLEKDHKGS